MMKKVLSLFQRKIYSIKSALDINGINIAVHPFGKDGLGKHLGIDSNQIYSFDGWEVYNASAELAVPGILPFGANENAAEYYKTLSCYNSNLGACAFTDGHSVEVIGRSYTWLNLKTVSIDNLRTAIQQNKNFNNLHMEPAKWDAFKHSVNMIKCNLSNSSA